MSNNRPSTQFQQLLPFCHICFISLSHIYTYTCFLFGLVFWQDHLKLKFRCHDASSLIPQHISPNKNNLFTTNQVIITEKTNTTFTKSALPSNRSVINELNKSLTYSLYMSHFPSVYFQAFLKTALWQLQRFHHKTIKWTHCLEPNKLHCPGSTPHELSKPRYNFAWPHK